MIGWKVKSQLLALDREPQLLLEAVALEHGLTHARVEHLEVTLAVGLGLVHRDVRVADQLIGGCGAAVTRGDAATDVHRHALRADVDRKNERVHDPLRDGDRGGLGVVAVLDHHRELVPAEARDQVLGPQAGTQARRDRHEQLVAGRVPEAVVDRLEVVEVDEQHRELAAAIGERTLDLVGEQRPVREVREWIVVGLVVELLLKHRQLHDGLLEAVVLERDARVAGERVE